MTELVAAAAPDELVILPRGKVRLHGIDFDEDFLSELVARHFRREQWRAKPRFSDAYEIYMRENPSAHRRKFKAVAQQTYAQFVAQFGDSYLDESLRRCARANCRSHHRPRAQCLRIRPLWFGGLHAGAEKGGD